MIFRKRWTATFWLVAVAVGAAAMAGCNDDRSGSRDAPQRVAKQPAAEPKPVDPAAQTESPQHPAVSAKVGPNGESPPSSPTPHSEGPPDELPTAIAPPPAELPDVALSVGHRATCKLFVGDALPPLVLADLDGNAAPLDRLFGERWTVVMFWQHDDPDAVEALTDFGPLVLDRYGSRGVRTIAIHVGDATEAVKSLAARLGLAFPLLVDADGSAFAQVANDPQGLMPRIFIVDASGRILWFDIEYSRTTRRDLDRALKTLTRE